MGSECEPLLLPTSGPSDADSPLCLPYKSLVSMVGSMALNEGEAQRLIEILSEKAGVLQDTWHKVGLSGSGCPTAAPWPFPAQPPRAWLALPSGVLCCGHLLPKLDAVGW